MTCHDLCRQGREACPTPEQCSLPITPTGRAIMLALYVWSAGVSLWFVWAVFGG